MKIKVFDVHKSIRIFISSPGDVAEERALTRKVIDRLQGEFSDRVTLEPIYWEHEPLLATNTFQDQLIRPSETDIVITILWSRLGTRLPAQFTKPDGSRYESGTEFEFEDAINSFRDRGTPDLLIYRKTADPQVSLKDKKILLNKLKQKEALDNFFDRWFHDKTEGTLIAAFHPFVDSANFEEIFEAHLSKLIKIRLPESTVSNKITGIKPLWEKGSPFRGLDVFNFEHAPVFFGRTKAISEIIDSLRIQAISEKTFILVLGKSGGGKSSLVRAGVLPMITQPGVIEGVGLWRRAIMKPGDSSGDLFDNLAASLLHQNALPELSADGTKFKELAKILRETPKAAVPLIKGGLSQAAAELTKSKQLTKQPDARLVLVIDQMEEMFSLESITQDNRKIFIEALDALSRSGRVWVIATLRSDFYPRTTELEGLVTLKEGTGQYDLLSPTTAEIGQMIRQPAQAARLYFEEDFSTNERLDDVLRDAAAKNPSALPLLEFTLEELYKQRTDDGMLTYEAYKNLGGVEGALAQRAEEVFSRLEPKVQQAMDIELHSLISIGVYDGERLSRKYAPLELVTATPETKAFVEAFVEARLFTTDLAVDGSATVNIAHEAILRHWPRLQNWVEKNKEDLRIHARVNTAANRWENEKCSREFLLSAGKQISEAEELVKNKSIELTNTEKTFVRASIAKRKRIWWIKRAIASVLVVLTIVASGAAYIAFQQLNRAETEAKTAEQVSDFLVGLFKVSDPSEALGDTITVREILDKGAEKIKEELKDQPEVQATLMITIGKVYQSLGLYKNAIPLIVSATEVRRKIFGDENIEVANGINELATLFHSSGDFNRAESLFTETIALTRRILGDEDTLLAQSLLNFGELKADIGKYEEAEPLFNDAMIIFQKHLGKEHRETVNCLNSIGGLKFRKGDIQGAEQVFTEVLRLNRIIYGDIHPMIATALNNLGGMKEHLGDLSSADSLMRESLALKRKIYGEKHPMVSAGLDNLGKILVNEQQYNEAEILYKEALQINRDLYGNESRSVAINLNNLAALYTAIEKLDTAEVLYKEALQINIKIHGEFHPAVATNLHNYSSLLNIKGNRKKAEAMSRESLEIYRSFVGDVHPAIATISDNLAKIMLAQGKYIEAEEKMRNVIEIREQVFPAGSWMITDSKAKWGNCLAKLKCYEEAELILLESYPILKLVRGEDHKVTKATVKYIINLYEDWDKPEKANKYRALLSN